MGLEVRAYSSLDEIAPLAGRLDALNLASRRPTPFATCGYLRAYLAFDEHARAGSAPLLLVAFDGSEPVGFLPMRTAPVGTLGLGATRVELLATHDTDRLTLASRPDDELRCRDAFLEHLTRRGGWSGLVWRTQDLDSPLALQRAPPGYRLRSFPGDDFCAIPLAHRDVGGLLRSLEKHHRANVRRLARRLLGAGGVEHVSSRGTGGAPELLELFLDVERRSWKRRACSGVGRNPMRVALFRALCGPAAPTGEPVFHFVLLDGVPVAAAMGTSFAGVLYLREIAFDEGFAALGPGNLLLLLVLRDAIAQGEREANLLNLHAYYKARWGAAVTATVDVQLFRVGGILWARALAGDMRRRIRAALGLPPRLPEVASRRDLAPEDRSAAAEAPGALGRAAERSRAAQLLASLEASGVRLRRLSGRELEAALPLDEGGQAQESRRRSDRAATSAGGAPGGR
ncbi:MAG TPA: GNAT family N-acetyltransferase [Anaeromyxobacteraceae bacterium]